MDNLKRKNTFYNEESRNEQSLFCQMNELHLTPKNNLVWRETARWLKFVEVVEGNGIYFHINSICLKYFLTLKYYR